MSLRYALLGFLSGTPMNGYALKALFDESIAHVWQAELSQIYRELESLEKQGLLRSTIEPQADRPNKRLYEATEAGRAAFLDWVRSVPESFAMPKRDEFMLRLFFGSVAGEEVVKEQFRRYIAEMRRVEAAAAGHSRLAERFPGDPRMARADQICREDKYCDFVRRRAVASAAAVRGWAEECLAELESGGRASPTPDRGA